MRYKIEQRGNKYYAITNKFHGTSKLIIDLEAVIHSDSCSFISSDYTAATKEGEYTFALSFIDDILYVNLSVIHYAQIYNYKTPIDIHNFIEECVQCVKTNKNLQNNKVLANAQQKLAQEAFINILSTQKDIFISNYIINCYAEVKLNETIYATASAININKTNITLFECTGKNIEHLSHDANYAFSIILYFNDIDENSDSCFVLHLRGKQQLFSVSVPYFRYLQFEWVNSHYETRTKRKDIRYINVFNKPYDVLNDEKQKEQDIQERYKYIIKNNTQKEIMDFIKSYRTYAVLIDINKFMVNEFKK